MTSAGSQTRSAILTTALHCFTDGGYDSVPVEEICRLSGSSIGSFYHHFGSKEGLAAVLYTEGIHSYQTGLLALLASPRPPRPMVASLVEHHFSWLLANQRRAQYLLEMGSAPATVGAHPAARRENQALVEATATWAAPLIEDGTLTPFEPAALLAQLFGPGYFITRAWLAGTIAIDDNLIDRFATAAWAAVRSQED